MGEAKGIVIVGAGEAGFHAARTLREEGYRGELTLIGAEPVPPYHRPPLSKGYLQGEEPLEKVVLQDQAWYAQHGIELRTGLPAMMIDRDEAQVVLADGSRQPYERLLLCTGSRVRPLPLPGADLPGVLSLRTLADADALREGIARASRVVLVGGGWIGLEVAAAARAAGCEVTVLEAAELPLVGVLGSEVAQIFADLHRAHGVRVRGGARVARLAGADAVTGVVLSDGTVAEADLVVVGVGAVPNVELAQAAGLELDNGIAVDEHLRTADPAIWAAGDVAAAWHPALRRRIRVEHVENASRQGRAVARSMLGSEHPYDELPYFYSDQYDLGMEYIGHTAPGEYDQVVLRGDVEALRFMAFWLSGGRVQAGMHANLWDATDPLRDLVASGRSVDPARLADPEVGLSEV